MTRRARHRGLVGIEGHPQHGRQRRHVRRPALEIIHQRNHGPDQGVQRIGEGTRLPARASDRRAPPRPPASMRPRPPRGPARCAAARRGHRSDGPAVPDTPPGSTRRGSSGRVRRRLGPGAADHRRGRARAGGRGVGLDAKGCAPSLPPARCVARAPSMPAGMRVELDTVRPRCLPLRGANRGPAHRGGRRRPWSGGVHTLEIFPRARSRLRATGRTIGDAGDEPSRAAHALARRTRADHGRTDPVELDRALTPSRPLTPH